MKKALSLLTILLLCTSIYLFIAYTNAKANQNADNKNVVVLEANYEITCDDIIKVFNITDLFYFRTYGSIYPILNNVEPRPFHYLDGALYTYIYNNKEESDIGLNEVADGYSPLLENRSGVEPLVCQANNALIIYVPDFSVKDRITKNMEWLLFLKEAEEKRGLSQSEVKSLRNRGYTEQEILEMSQEEIDRVLSLSHY